MSEAESKLLISQVCNLTYLTHLTYLAYLTYFYLLKVTYLLLVGGMLKDVVIMI